MIQKGKILSILKKWPSIMSFKALVIFALIFIPAVSHGAVLFGQLDDNTGYVSNPSNSHVLVGSFTLSSEHIVGYYSEWQVTIKNTSGWPSCNTGSYVDVSGGDGTWAGRTNPQFSIGITNEFFYDGSTWKTYSNTTWASENPSIGGSGISTTTLPAGTYYVWLHTQCNPGNFDIKTNVGQNEIYGYITDQDGYSPPTPPVTDYTTHIVSFSPANNSTTTSPVTFSLHGYINPDDLTTIKGVKLTLHNIDQNVILLGSLSPSDIYLFEGNATTSGDFYFSTSTPLGDGNYRLEACIERTYFWGWIINIFSPINDCQSHQFVVGQETFIGHISQSIWDETQSLFASSTATSTTALAGSCNPLSGSFSVTNCSAFLFVPDGKGLSDTMKSAREGILSRVPWGYLTRLYYLMNNSATTTLPSFTTTIQVGPGDDMTPEQTTLSFDVGDMVAGAGSLVDSIEDPIHGKTFRDVFYPIIQLVVALGVIITIVSDITGSHRHNDGGEVRQTKLS